MLQALICLPLYIGDRAWIDWRWVSALGAAVQRKIESGMGSLKEGDLWENPSNKLCTLSYDCIGFDWTAAAQPDIHRIREYGRNNFRHE